MSFPLPADLPVPEDDGAADHLEGMAVPAVRLMSNTGFEVDLAGAARIGSDGRGTLVLYIYPRTGTPGAPLPDGWDDIPGARGCTPQARRYQENLKQFDERGVSVAGISSQTTAEQVEFAKREDVIFPLLSDPELALADALRLPTFEVDGMRLYKRLTLVIRAGQIIKTFYPVFPPDRDAEQVLDWLESAPASG